MTLPLLEGTDGIQKMSKSLDNYVGFTDPPVEKFGKLMSIPDDMILKYMELAAFASAEEMEKARDEMESGKVNPMDIKKRMARKVIEIYHSEDDANAAQKEFERVFSKGKTPEDIDVAKYPQGTRMWIVDLLRENGLVESGGEARRLIKQGAVSIDGQKITDMKLEYEINQSCVIKVGKRRFIKVEIQ